MKVSVPRLFLEGQRAHCRGLTLLELLLAIVVLGTLMTLAVSTYGSYVERVKVATAETDITQLETQIAVYQQTYFTLPTSLAQIGADKRLDPWGHPYYYLDFTGLRGTGQMRKDRNLVPINSDYDLYSAGADGATKTPLVAPVSQDDVIRANNGAFVGLASDY